MVEVAEAARVLGVTPRRVRAQIAVGRLPARKFAGAWDVDAAALNRTAPSSRPMAEPMAWAVTLLGDGRDADWLIPQERYRARRALDRLAASDDPALMVLGWLARRADRKPFWCQNPSALLGDGRVCRGGVSDERASMTVAGFAEGYLPSADLEPVELDHGLISATVRAPNVILHVVTRVIVPPLPTLCLVADLAEYGPGRERGQADRIANEWQQGRRR